MDEIHYEHDYEMVNSYMMVEVDPWPSKFHLEWSKLICHCTFFIYHGYLQNCSKKWFRWCAL
jgi:hypothetical protein